jgi:putative ABC transport system ATP-binding protein
MSEIIKTHNLCKQYRSEDAPTVALNGVSLRLRPGEFVALMGPSGCGKSTLLHLLGGLDRPDTGEIFLDDQRVDRLSERRWAVLRRSRVGFVFQSFNLLPHLSVADNIELPALMAGHSVQQAQSRCQALLTQLNLSDKAHRPPSKLSGGQQQRVALARALVNEPAVLLADEPTGNLDSSSADEVMAQLAQFHAAGQTIFLVTHDPRIASAADRVLHMRDGRLVAETHLNGGQRLETLLNTLVELEAQP